MKYARFASFQTSAGLRPGVRHWQRYFPYYLLIWLMPFILFKFVRTEVDPNQVKPIAALLVAVVYGVWVLKQQLLIFEPFPWKRSLFHWLKGLFKDFASLAFLLMLGFFVLSRAVHLEFPGSLLLNPQQRSEGFLYFIALFVLYRMGKNAPALGDSFWSSFGISVGLSAYLRIAEYYKFPLIINPTRLMIGSTFRYYSEFDGFPYSTQGNPNFFSTYLALTLPICLYLLLQRKKLWALLPLGLQFFALVMNESRSGMVGLAVALPIYWLVVVLYEKKNHWVQWLLLAAFPFSCLFGFLLLLYFFPDTANKFQVMVNQISYIQRYFHESVPLETLVQLGSGRGYGYYTALLAIGSYPWLGLGFGNIRESTKVLIIPMVKESIRSVYEQYHTPHNVYLQRAAESGLPSLACYLFLIITSLLHAGRKLKSNPRYAVLICAILSYAVQALFNIATPGTSWLFYFLLGLAAGEHGMDLQPEDTVHQVPRTSWQKIWAVLDGRY